VRDEDWALRRDPHWKFRLNRTPVLQSTKNSANFPLVHKRYAKGSKSAHLTQITRMNPNVSY
jgi:hypothetical protein